MRKFHIRIILVVMSFYLSACAVQVIDKQQLPPKVERIGYIINSKDTFCFSHLTKSFPSVFKVHQLNDFETISVVRQGIGDFSKKNSIHSVDLVEIIGDTHLQEHFDFNEKVILGEELPKLIREKSIDLIVVVDGDSYMRSPEKCDADVGVHIEVVPAFFERSKNATLYYPSINIYRGSDLKWLGGVAPVNYSKHVFYLPNHRLLGEELSDESVKHIKQILALRIEHLLDEGLIKRTAKAD